VPVDNTPAGHLRAFASKGKLTVELDESSEFSVEPPVVAATLRQFALSLPEPLIGAANVDALLTIADDCVGNNVCLVCCVCVCCVLC
jgi:hypothetical protein